MPTFTLPDTVKGGSITVTGGSLQEAQQNAANATGASLAQQQGGGTFGANTFGGGGSSGGSSGGGGGGAGSSGEQTFANTQAAGQVFQAAQAAAQQAYLTAKLNLDTDELAFRKAQQAWANTMAERQQTFSEGQAQAGTALDYLKLGSQLTGPANAFRYARMLSGTPGGLRDIVNAAAGRYVLPRSGAGDASVPGERMSLDSLAADSGAGGAISPYAAGVPTPSLPNPNQVNLRNYGAMLPGQKALLLAAYQDQGWDPADVDKMIAQSAPRYSGPSLGRVQF